MDLIHQSMKRSDDKINDLREINKIILDNELRGCNDIVVRCLIANL